MSFHDQSGLFETYGMEYDYLELVGVLERVILEEISDIALSSISAIYLLYNFG